MASCNERMAFICHRQINAIKAQVGMHMEYIITNSIRLYHARGSRVLVERLQKKLQCNGMEGVVVKMNDPRMCIPLGHQKNRHCMLKRMRPQWRNCLLDCRRAMAKEAA